MSWLFVSEDFHAVALKLHAFLSVVIFYHCKWHYCKIVRETVIENGAICQSERRGKTLEKRCSNSKVCHFERMNQLKLR